ncbi:hypothetical protein [Mesorhizobium sp. CAU 1741]|uniref:hypothetical protein n=1 Tax=Mesorhizobium sp. CAU 1741 TaxID=3140366 RepID=UPI00325BD300
MELIDSAAMAWSGQEERHRAGVLNFKTLFIGREGNPNNFRWVLSRTDGDYRSPHHRHNFDQIRMCLSGIASVAPGKDLHAGDIGYFPEGTYYGPQEDINRQRTGLILQGGGASGLGYMSAAQLRKGQEELEKVGTFAKGRFTRNGEPPENSRDSYEAIWEHVFARPIDYPAARYEEPIIMRPGAFAWVADRDAKGVSRKHLGSYTERGTTLELIQIGAGEQLTLGSPNAFMLVFVLKGSGRAGEQDWRAETAMRIEAGETADLRATENTEIFAITLPLLDGVAA